MKIIEKLRKLILHEQSARSIGNLFEAEAFAGKIQELLDAHNLSMSDIDFEQVKSSINKTSEHEFEFLNQWERLFMGCIAKLNGCRMIGCGRGIVLIGSEVDRLIVIEIYRYFISLARILAENSLKEYKLTVEYRRKRKKTYHSKHFKSSFLHGFVLALNIRFREKHEEAKKQSSNSQALIFIGNKLTEADKWISENLKTTKKDVRPIKWAKFKDEAFRKGMKAGNNVALTTKTID